MPRYDRRCASCGWIATDLWESVDVGNVPCPQCDAPSERAWLSVAPSVNGDEIPGGFVQENFGNEPETFYSKSAMAARAKELGLEPMVRWSGEHDRHVQRWDVPCQYTLESAAALVGRMK